MRDMENYMAKTNVMLKTLIYGEYANVDEARRNFFLKIPKSEDTEILLCQNVQKILLNNFHKICEENGINNLSRVDEKFHFYCLKRIHNKFMTMDRDTVMTSDLFTESEKKEFDLLRDKTFLLKFIIKKICRFIFSIYNTNSKRHKILCILGIRLKLKGKNYYKLENKE